MASDDATGHMLPRFRSLDAVYAQDWNRVENIMPTQPAVGVHLKKWAGDSSRRNINMFVAGPLWSGAWNYDNVPKFHYGDDTTYRKGMAFLDGYGTIEDWGCGFAHARTFVHSSRYVGIDGSSPHADKIVDLANIGRTRTASSCAMSSNTMSNGGEILAGAIASFRKRMVLIVFTPFAETTRIISTALNCTSVSVPDISFRKADLTQYFRDLRYTEESLKTDTQYSIEHVFYTREVGHDTVQMPTPGQSPDASSFQPSSFF